MNIDAPVHSRLIGSKGRNIRKIMDEFKVDIKFPRKTDPDPNIVTIVGTEENVADAKDRLLNLAKEYVSNDIITIAVTIKNFRKLAHRSSTIIDRDGT